MKPAPGVVGGLGSAVGVTAKVTDTVLGSTIGAVAKVGQSALLGSLPDEAVTGSFQEEAPKRKRPRGSRLLFWRKPKPTSAQAKADAPPAAEPLDTEAAAALKARIDEVLEGGLPVPAARVALEQCVEDDLCDVKEKAEELKSAELILYK